MNSSNRYDLIIIGAGLGGLSAALEASRRGKKVLLLEQHNLPGGFATSFVRGRFEFEPSLHEMARPEFQSSVILYLKDAGLNIKFLEIPEAYRLVHTDSNLDITVPHGIENFIDCIEKNVPDSREAVTKYMNLCLEIKDTFDFLTAHPTISKFTLLKKYGNFIRTGSATAQEVADKLNVPIKAQEIINGYWCYLGTPMSELSFSLWAAMLVFFISGAAIIPHARSHEISSAFVERIEECGGKLFLNTRVDEIIVKNNKVEGVRASDGKDYLAEKILSNTSPVNVYNNLIKPHKKVPLKAFQNINARKQGLSLSVVYLGLDIDHKELGLDQYSYFISPHIDTDELYKDTGKLAFDQPQLAAVCLNVANPDCSPPGTTILSITIGTDSKSWNNVQSHEYFDLKNMVADRVIGYFEKSMKVNLREHIEEIEVATPQTFARYTGAYNGSVYGYQVETWDGPIPRALAEKRETYIQGLTFCGSYTEQAYGYEAAILSGRNAISKIDQGEKN